MLKWLTSFSLRNGSVVLIAMLMVLFGGVYSYFKIPNANFPDVDIPWIHVSIVYPGSTPEQVYRDIGKPLEQRLATISGVTKLFSFSMTNTQYFTLEVSMDRRVKDVDRDIQDVLTQVQLPESAQKPVIRNETVGNPAVYTFTVTSDADDVGKIQSYVNDKIEPVISAVNGVGEVRVNGDTKKNIYVKVNPDKMKRMGITWQQVQQALVANNFSSPIGSFSTERQTMPIVVVDKVTSLQDIENIPIVLFNHNTNGVKVAMAGAQTSGFAMGSASTVRLGDVADVTYEPDPNNRTITRTDGKPGVVVQVLSAPNANTVEVVKGVENALSTIALPHGYHLSVLDNQATDVMHNVQSMVREAALGAIFAVIVTLLFLRDLRATLVAVVSIPLSILAAVVMMNAMGYSLNIMTLSGMAVAVGRVVDDSIVVIENIYRRLKSRGTKPSVQSIKESTLEVGTAITSSTITTLAVFLPMTVLPGIVGHFFAPFAWTVIIALTFSLLVALMVVPLMSTYSFRRTPRISERETALQKGYRSLLRWSLSHKWVVVILSVLLLLESGFAATKIGFNFLPTSRITTFTINASMPVASSIQATNAVARRIEQRLASVHGIKTYQTFVSPSDANVVVFVADSVQDTDAFANHLRSIVERVQGAHRITVSGADSFSGGQMALILQGQDVGQLHQASDTIVSALSKIPGLADVTSSAMASTPQVQVNIDAKRAGKYGLDPTTLAQAIRDMVNGETVTQVNFDGATTDVNLTLGSRNIHSLQELGQQTIESPTGQRIEIQQVAKLSVVKGPTAIARLNQQEYIEIDGTITSKNPSQVTAAVDKTIQSLALPKGVTVSQEGAAKDMREGFINIGIAMCVSFVLVLIAMLITFGEWAAPLAIVFALPFAVVGGFNGLWITRQPLGMPGMIGFMMLIGIIVTNAIVLMDRVERQQKAGLTVREALIEAGGVRLRPILMTATATIGALIPLAITNEAGLISKTLAIVVIGGLLTSTLLTLVIVPIMYEWFSAVRERVHNRKSRHANANVVSPNPVP